MILILNNYMKKSKIILILLSTILTLSLIYFVNQRKTTFDLEKEYYNNAELIEIDSNKLKKLEDQNKNFILFVHTPGVCTFQIPFEPIVRKFITENKITIYSLPYNEIDNTSINKYLKYSPSIIIFKDGKMYKYLDPNSKKDLSYYQSLENFTKWIKESVNLK